MTFRALIHEIDKAITEWIAKIDWDDVKRSLEPIAELAKTYADGRWHAQIVKTAVEEAQSHLDEKERQQLRESLTKFETYFAEIIQSKDKCDKQTVLRVVEQTLLIGMRCNLTPERLEKLQAEINRQRTTSAHAARRADCIQTIIERRARELWHRKPSFKGNNNGTATEICENVLTDVAALENIPNGWKRMINRGSDSKKKTIDTIAKRVARIPVSEE